LSQDSLFGETVERPSVKPTRGLVQRHRVLITVKAAPNPSSTYGETVCVAGIRLGDVGPQGWIRLYPINFRHLSDKNEQFKKYDIVTVECRPANEARLESWRPMMATLVREAHVPPWKKRRPLIDPLIEDSMCAIRVAASKSAAAPSLGLVRPSEVIDFRIERHPGWTKSDQAKIDKYVNQLDLFDEQDKSPLEAPRFIGSYRWRCGESSCMGHEQRTLDWEFAALQRHLWQASEADAKEAIRKRFLDELCAPSRDVAFYVGNQAKRPQTFSILGVYYPERGA